MSNDRKNIAILGSTGSIGRSTLEVIAAADDCLRAIALSAHQSFDLLCQQAQQFQPRWVVATDPQAAANFDWSALPSGTTLLTCEEGIAEVTSAAEVDTVVAAMVGSAGLRSVWTSLQAGKTVALANKETLVMAGRLMTDLAKSSGGMLIPVDSEHSAIFQCLQAGRRDELKRIILTASGGPFLNHTAEQLANVTIDDALAHPTWDMGPKVTIDSSTMMNKALEIIEARWLFDLAEDQIDVVIHPQSIVHSLVEFCDGSMIAQLSPPDMKLPIQYALSFPARWPGIAAKLDISQAHTLEFQPPDLQRFEAISLGLQAARDGGTAGAVLSAANEEAVAKFLDGVLNYTEIVPTCRRVLQEHQFESSPTLDDLFSADRWARQEVSRCICT